MVYFSIVLDSSPICSIVKAQMKILPRRIRKILAV